MSRVFAPVGVVLLMGAVASSAWAQPSPIDIPVTSGRSIPADASTATFIQPVYTTGDVDLRLQVFVDGVCKYNACRRVLTSGPYILAIARVPVGTFGLSAGGNVNFKFTVDHVGATAGKRSVVQILLPVVPGASDPPTTTTRASDGSPRRLRREPVGIGNA